MFSGIPVRWRRGALLVGALWALGCDSGAREQMRQQLAQLQTISAEKDSLLEQVAENARLMSEISTELAKVRGGRGGMVVSPESPLQLSRDSILLAIRDVTTRVNESEERLRASQQRVRALTGVNDSLRASIVSFEATIANFQTVIENQKVTIASLADQVNSLMAQNIRLASEKAALQDTVLALEEIESTVYYVIGTKDELIERGIVTEQGGSRVLFIFGKRGRTLVPATELNESQFVAINKYEVTEIPLPNPDKRYRIASRQNVTHLAQPPDKDGKVQGTLQITSPEEFWEASKFLIIVES
jgi:hypothetical protein